MGWVIFFIWMFLGIIANICMMSDRETTREIKEREKIVRSRTASAVEKEVNRKEIELLKKDKKSSEIGWQAVMWIGVGILFVGLCYVVGLIWYYLCCGFMVVEEPNFFWKIIYGALSLLFLGFVFTVIAEIFGWGPWKRK